MSEPNEAKGSTGPDGPEELAAQALKRRIADAARAESKRARERKEIIDFDTNAEYWWTLKAKDWLFDEAARVIEALVIDPDTSIPDAKREILQAIKGYDGWGWGSNWSDSIHRATIAKVEWFFQERLKAEPEAS